MPDRFCRIFKRCMNVCPRSFISLKGIKKNQRQQSCFLNGTKVIIGNSKLYSSFAFVVFNSVNSYLKINRSFLYIRLRDSKVEIKILLYTQDEAQPRHAFAHYAILKMHLEVKNSWTSIWEDRYNNTRTYCIKQDYKAQTLKKRKLL